MDHSFFSFFQRGGGIIFPQKRPSNYAHQESSSSGRAMPGGKSLEKGKNVFNVLSDSNNQIHRALISRIKMAARSPFSPNIVHETIGKIVFQSRYICP